MTLRCYLLSIVRLHSPECERCKAHGILGDEMRKRLEELNWRKQPRSLIHGDNGEVAEVFNSKAPEGAARRPVSVKEQQERKTG